MTMNKTLSSFIIALFLSLFCPSVMKAAIGDWQAYMSYHDVQEIEEAGNIIFVQASNSLYAYNKTDHSITLFSKADVLNDCVIQHIRYNKTANRLLILYSNGNIDFLSPSDFDTTTNLSDYYSYTTTEDKTVNDIYMSGQYAYLSNGFGIVKVNMKDNEISDTYKLGMKTYWCEIKDNKLYAYCYPEGVFSAPLSANLLDKTNWKRVGDYYGKTEEDKTALKELVATLNPGGPKYNYFGFLKFYNNKLYTCGGGRTYTDLNRPGCIQVLNGDNWQIYQDDIAEKTNNRYVDTDVLVIDASNESHVTVGGRTGMYEFNDGNFVQAFNNDNTNSVLQSAYGQGNKKHYVIVNALAYDTNGNLWGFNSLTPSTTLFAYTKDKQWVSYHHNEFYYYQSATDSMSLQNVQSMFFDSRNLLWFCNNHWNKPSISCYQPSTDGVICYTQFKNQDGTDVAPTFVRAAAEDKNKNIWIGTNVGPVMLESSQVTKDEATFTQVKVPRNDGTNTADYLLSGVDISCIAIDAANRKWFGTSGNGVYLISADNLTEVKHFTATNSPLLSDNIESIALDEKTGNVYFGTDQGLCSYQSDVDVVNDEMTKDNVWAYPNPVTPDYTGYITITGLTVGADVKIVTSSGMLVHEGRSTSGSYQWNGLDAKGRKVASGIYMVETATSDGSKGTVCKIAIVR